MRGGGWDGRGNLRENREDPAPTVGRLRGWHCDPHRAQRTPIGAAMRVPCPHRTPPTYGDPMVFIMTRHLIATRCAASLQTPFPHMRMRAPPPPFARAMPHMETPVFTTTRHAASLRSSNNCKCLTETFFIARGGSPLHKRLNPRRAFGRVPLWSTAVYNRFSRSSKDVATRRAASLSV